MLENYDANYTAERAIAIIQKEARARTKKEALAIARKKIPKESYYQDKIRKRLRQKYPEGFCRKISQGVYAEAGIPDLLFIYEGHYFGFEVKRPLVGRLSDIQRRTIRLIEKAGGTAAVVCWPEEAIKTVEDWRKANGLRRP